MAGEGGSGTQAMGGQPAGGLPAASVRLAALAGCLVAAAVLASWAAATSAVAGVLAALLAGAVVGITVHGLLQARVLRPLGKLHAAAGLPGTAGLPELEAAFADLQHRAERLARLEAQTSGLRHDLRGILSPALLTADRLTGHEDPKVARTGEVVIRAINRATDRLSATKDLP